MANSSRNIRLKDIYSPLTAVSAPASENTLGPEILYQKLALDKSAIVAETDKFGKITYVNQKFTEISGYSEAELIGQDHRLLNSRTHPKEFFKNLWQTIKCGYIWTGEICNRKKTGELYWVYTTIYPVLDLDGQPKKFIAIRFDITDKKKALEDLKILNEKLEEASRFKDEFLANMSHEIRTPLNSLIGMADVLAETPLTDEQKKYVRTFKKAGQNLLHIVNDILDLSKIEANKISIESSPFSLREITSEVIDIAEPTAQKKQISVFTETHQLVGDIYIGDAFRIKQVLMNLIGNSLKFTQKGHISLKVSPNNSSDIKGNILFEITDTGIGISDTIREKLFKAFSQGDSTISRKYGGTGLGLLICKHLIEKMGGLIWVDSKFTEGSRFFFTLELKEQPTGSLNTSPSDIPPPHVEYQITESELPTSLKILIVDDSEDNRQLLKLYLNKLNYQIYEASDGNEALEIATTNKMDLVLMDMYMPNLNGYEATALIRQWEKTHHEIPTPIIALTASVLESDAKKAIDAGCNTIVGKPITKNTLLRCISTYKNLEATQSPLKPSGHDS